MARNFAQSARRSSAGSCGALRSFGRLRRNSRGRAHRGARPSRYHGALGMLRRVRFPAALSRGRSLARQASVCARVPETRAWNDEAKRSAAIGRSRFAREAAAALSIFQQRQRRSCSSSGYIPEHSPKRPLRTLPTT